VPRLATFAGSRGFGRGFVAISAGNFELIETALVGAGGQSSITFSNLNAYSTTYQHLQIRYTARSSRISADPMIIRVNNTTQSASHHLFGDASSVNDGAGGTSYAVLFAMAGTNLPSSAFGAGIIEIPDAYETTKNKHIRAFAGAPGEATSFDTTFWPVTAAINTLQLSTFSGTNFVNGSRFSIYGLRSTNA